MAETGPDIQRAKHFLTSGEIVAIPTETVYGLAANALDERAILKIFKAKNRPFFDPLILHLSGIDQVEKYAGFFPAKARLLAEKFWPGPLTIVLPKRAVVPDLATAGQATVALRVPDHPLTLKLLQSLDFPLAAPSANPFGYISPTLPRHVEEQLGYVIPYILDGGSCKVGLESTIISFTGEPTILRLGGLPIEKIVAAIGSVIENLHQNSNPSAPGQMDKHYSPHTKFFLEEDPEQKLQEFNTKKIALIRFSTYSTLLPEKTQFILSPSGDLNEAAINLFRILRETDEAGYDLIIGQKVPDQGLGRAINDRLERASTD